MKRKLANAYKSNDQQHDDLNNDNQQRELEASILQNIEDYRLNKTTGTLCSKFFAAAPVIVARPNSAQVEKIQKLIQELKKLKPVEKVFIFTSEPDYEQFSAEENIVSAIILNNQRLFSESKSHFLDLVNRSIHNIQYFQTCYSSDDHTFLTRLIHKLKKQLKSVKTELINKPNFSEENKGINTRVSSTKIKTMIYLRNVENKTFSEIAKIVQTSRFTVSRILKQCKNKPISDCFQNIKIHKPKIISPQIVDAIRLFVANRRGLVSSKTISDFLNEKFSISVSRTTIYNVLKYKLNLRKRVGSTYVPWINSIRLKLCRYYFLQKYLEFIKQGFIPACLDESGIQISEFDKYVWVEKGSYSPKSHPLLRKQWNLLLGISLDGFKNVELHLGSTNQVSFLAFLNEFLYCLKTQEKITFKKYFLILDNATFHKTHLIKSLSSKFEIPFLFIPTYSSFLNPVEYMFNYIKSSLNYCPTLTWHFYFDFNAILLLKARDTERDLSSASKIM